MRLFSSSALIAAALAAPAFAKLPPLSDEAKAKAAETTAKTAWSDKVGLYKVCLTMDRVAERYRKTAASAPAPTATAACADPGPFVAPEATSVAATPAAATPLTPAKDKPIEASEAHSPPGMAVSPPSSKATAAETMGGSKK